MLIYQRVATFPENLDGRFWMAPKADKKKWWKWKRRGYVFDLFWSISYLFQPLLAENQKKKTHGKIWAKKEETLALQRWGPQLFSDSAPHLSFSTSGEIQREVSTNIMYIYMYTSIQHIYIYVCVCMYMCIYVHVYTSVSAGWCEQPPWNPQIFRKGAIVGGTQKNFHANCLDHEWIKLFLAFFAMEKHGKPCYFSIANVL